MLDRMLGVTRMLWAFCFIVAGAVSAAIVATGAVYGRWGEVQDFAVFVLCTVVGGLVLSSFSRVPGGRG